MQVRLLSDINLGLQPDEEGIERTKIIKEGDVVNVEDEAKALKWIEIGVAEPVEKADEGAENPEPPLDPPANPPTDPPADPPQAPTTPETPPPTPDGKTAEQIRQELEESEGGSTTTQQS